MRRSSISPLGVLITTALRVPIRARAIGTTLRVSSGSSWNRVAISNGLESFSMVRPGRATSMAAGIPTGTLSMNLTSSTMGIGWGKRLLMSTPSSFCTMAPVILTPLNNARFSSAAALSNSVVPGMMTTHSESSTGAVSNWSRAIVWPSPNPCPPGVEGLWPIIADSVMIVSVMVSMAISPMTGVASLSRITLRSFRSTAQRIQCLVQRRR